MNSVFSQSIIPFLRHDLDHSKEIKRVWYSDWIVRLVLWLLFVAIGIIFIYQPQRTMQHAVESLSSRSIDAANQGFPFYFANIGAPGFVRFNQIQNTELGIYLLNAGAYVVGYSLFGTSFQLPPNASAYLIFGIILLTSFLFFSPTVPILISIGGNIALLVSLYTGAISPWFPASFWGATYGAIVTCMMLAIVFTVGTKGRLHIYAHIFLLAVLAVVAKYLREESTILVYGVVGIVVVATLLARLVSVVLARRRQNLIKPSQLVPLQPLIYCLLFAAVIYMSQFFVRAIYALAWDVPYSETNDSLHGSGHPLLVGLGYADNPYNLAWDDLLGTAQAQMRLNSPSQLVTFEAVISVLNSLYVPEYQSRAGKVALSVMAENPGLVLKNVTVKAGDVLKWLFPANAVGPTALEYIPIFIPLSPFVLILALLVIIVTGAMSWYFGLMQAWYLAISSVGLLGLSLVSPLIIHPFYISSLRGALYSCALIFLGASATLGLNQQLRSHVAKSIILWATVAIATLAICVVVGAGVIYLVVDNRYHQHLNTVASSDAVSELTSTTFHFADVFNDLDKPQQENILSALQAAPNIRTYSVVTKQSDPEQLLNNPRIMVQGQYIYVIAQLGVNNQRPVGGTRIHVSYNTSVALRVSIDCSSPDVSKSAEIADKCDESKPHKVTSVLTGLQGYDWTGLQQWPINDGSWDAGRLRMYALPIASTSFADTQTSLALTLYNNTELVRFGTTGDVRASYILQVPK